MDPSDIPTFAELAADPEIVALLDFTPVPRDPPKPNGWIPELQRMFIAYLAHYGSATSAAAELGKARSGIDKVMRSPGAEEFRASWDGAMALAEKRRMAALVARPTGAGAWRAPRIGSAASTANPVHGPADIHGNFPQQGQRLNYLGEWEDEASIERRGEEAAESIRSKLLRCRRAYLCTIANNPGKRAAFEILTELPIDWDRAARLEPQFDEPYNIANQREPDMILTAESGWSFGEHGYGPDKKAQARQVINNLRAERGQEPVDWSESTDRESTERS